MTSRALKEEPIDEEKGRRSARKEKKKTRRHNHSSSSSSEEEEEGLSVLDRRLKQGRNEQKRLRGMEKERLKETETPEQKRARRLAKKLKKTEKRRHQEGKSDPEIGYTNLENPFNDPTLTTETFRWQKKLKVEGKADISNEELEKRNRKRVEQSLIELEKLRKQREMRDAARADREMMQRDVETKQFKQWEKMEDTYHFQTAKQRSEIRIKQGRAKAIDMLARYISFEDGTEKEDVELTEPYNYLTGLTIRDLEDLMEDIRVYRSMEGDKHGTFWMDVRIVTEDELMKLRRRDPNSQEYIGDRLDAVNTSVRTDVDRIFKGKTHRDLALLETQIRSKITGQQEGVDVAYWESLLKHLVVHMARARLKERHGNIERSRLARIKGEVKVEVPIEVRPVRTVRPETRTAIVPQPVKFSTLAELEVEDEEERDRLWNALAPDQLYEATRQLYSAGQYSPTYVKDAMPGIEVLSEELDASKREAKRQSDTGQEKVSSREAELEASVRRAMGNGKEEAVFSVEAPLEAQAFLWSDKYRPRKPRYFNRVHTGFEWNKYNQTHYDVDNPPPKIVQGYRFNIFYPDLLDPTQTPSFTVLPDTDPDFSVLRFHAGPPYEDIAFKLVNREWEINHKHGYKCQFQNGIFQLWFFFKKYRYRR